MGEQEQKEEISVGELTVLCKYGIRDESLVHGGMYPTVPSRSRVGS